MLNEGGAKGASEELARRSLALQNEVARLVAQGYRVHQEGTTSVTLIPIAPKVGPGKIGLLALLALVGIPAVVLMGFLIPIIGWFLAGVGWVFGLIAIWSWGMKPKQVTVRPDGKVEVR